MSLRRAAPGPQLSAGRMRVDAARAIAKLREYQLADKTAWVLEAIRAAVADGAKRIDLRADRNDVWLSWEGEPWPDELLPRLFDELVSPEPAPEMERDGPAPARGRDQHHVRLLAAAVNSALGMEPAYVDVIAVREAGATRVRYTPEILAEPASELGDAALRHVIPEALEPLEGAAPGTLVHLRRRLVDWRLFSEPPELALARDACLDIPVPLHIGDRVFQRGGAHDVVRVPLGEELDGFIAVTTLEYAAYSPVLVVAERGVVLAEYVLDLIHTQPDRMVPLRVYIDAARMPTNASRSQVRRDAFPIADAEARAKKLVGEVIAQLAKLAPASEPARKAALALLGAVARPAAWSADLRFLQGPLRPLIELPLVENAVGQPRALAESWRSEVHTGDKPFPAELAPWLGDVLWARPYSATRLLIDGATLDVRGTRRLARFARQQLRAQQRFYAHTRREARVLSAQKPHIRAALGCIVEGTAVTQELFAGVSGEVCIYDAGNAALVVLLEGRELERIEFDSPLAFDVVIDSTKLTPADRYRGVKRDAEYKRVERVMRAGLVRALELHARSAPRGHDAALDARLFRAGFGVLGELGIAVRGVLAGAAAYHALDGRWLSLDQLRAEKVIGYTTPGHRPCVPAGRVVIELDDREKTQLASLVTTMLVPYRRDAPIDEAAMLDRLVGQSGGALLIAEGNLTAAITASTYPQLRLHHLGTELDERPYLWKWLPCTIAVDSPALVPDPSWTALADHAGLRDRDYGAWELGLLRVLAAAAIGEAPAHLVLGRPLRLDEGLGIALCNALRNHDPRELLGDELIGKLRSARLVTLLGRSEPCSIVEAAALFPGKLPCVPADAKAVAGFTPIVGGTGTIGALAKLVGREVEDGTPELQRRQRSVLRDFRLEAHRKAEQRPLRIPVADPVPFQGLLANGIVGPWDGVCEIRVYVEGRPFDVLHPKLDLPLVAAVEITAQQCDDLFEKIPPPIAKQLAEDVKAALRPLVLARARQRPAELGSEGPMRTLLAALLGEGAPDHELRTALVEAPIFPTVQGTFVSLEQAAHPRAIISVAAWQGSWLPPGDGEPPHALDGIVLWVPDLEHEISRIMDQLHPGPIIVVTDDVAKLQARRRMARGLIPRPRVPAPPPGLVRDLATLGDAGAAIGVGEIALGEDIGSTALLFEQGVEKHTEKIDATPSIVIAVELAEHQTLAGTAQTLATALVEQLAKTGVLATARPKIRRNLLRAALTRHIDGFRIGDVPLFFPYDASAPKWPDFAEQHAKHGDVWAVAEPTDLAPLDPARRVFVMEPADIGLARGAGWNVVDATKELQYDATARKNRARPAAASLELPSRDGVLAQVMLPGDGKTSPRGIVAVLAPHAAQWRGIWPHREMHPFDRVEDPCRWPTLAVIDDLRIVPDRTWSVPARNDAWSAIAKELRDASERALATLGDVPADAIAHLRINNHTCADVTALRKAPKSQIRGVLWLVETPRKDVAIQVSDDRQQQTIRSFVPPNRLSLGGKLLVFASDGLDRHVALEQLCVQVHGRLVRQLLKQETLDKDIAAAHVAHALEARTLRANDARGIKFRCFSPRSLEAKDVAALLRRTDKVTVIKPDATPHPDPNVIELVDDGSIVAQTLLADLGDRARRARPTLRPHPVSQAPEIVHVSAPEPPPVRTEKPKPPAPPHPLERVTARLRSRLADLGIGGYEWEIVDDDEPMFVFDQGIKVAGNNVRLRALAAALAANSAFAAAGIDVVVAHLVTVLNVALSQITDASEAHAIGVLLANPPSAGRPRSRQSS